MQAADYRARLRALRRAIRTEKVITEIEEEWLNRLITMDDQMLEQIIEEILQTARD